MSSALEPQLLKPYLDLTIGDNVQYSTLREHVLQWGPFQQKWATSMVASSSTDYQGPMPMDIDRVDGLIFTGCPKYINEIFLPKIQDRVGDEFNFLRRTRKLEKGGPWIQPGNYIQQMLKAYAN